MKNVMGWVVLLCAVGCGSGSSGARVDLRVTTSGLDAALYSSLAALEVDVFQPTGSGVAGLTCSSLLDGTHDPDGPLLESARVGGLDMDTDAHAATLEGFATGRTLFLIRGRDEACGAVAAGCAEAPLFSEQMAVVTVRLLPVDVPSPCPATTACVDGRCVTCDSDEQCDDGDPCTFGECDEGTCTFSAAQTDGDRDGAGAAVCGGDDCDDADPLVYPGAARRCGRGVDHDCDGVIDDAQGCGECNGATGLVLRASIDTPAVGLFAVGSEPDGDGIQELFVGTPASIEVYTVPASGAPSLQGSTPFLGVEPLPPAVLGAYTLVADFGTGGLRLFETEALRAGDGEALSHVGTEQGTVSAMVADRRYAYIAVGAGEGSLATIPTSGLPALPEPETMLGSGQWRNSAALALDRGPSRGWIFGVLGQYIAWAELDDGGEVLRSGSASVMEGFGWDIAVLPEWLLLAQGDRGLMMVDRARVVSDERCCSEADYSYLMLPAGCVDEHCEHTVVVAPLGADRVLAMTHTNSGPQRSFLYLIDTSDPSALAPVGDPIPLSHPTATGRDIWVSGSTVYVAGKVQDEAAGVVDVFDLVCPD